jgi:hypothetical protein
MPSVSSLNIESWVTFILFCTIVEVGNYLENKIDSIATSTNDD